jgi:hypothetical protein
MSDTEVEGRTLISTHPAGQSTGQGEDNRNNASGAQTKIGAALDASMQARGANRQQAFFREAATRVPAPDSTRTGDVKMPDRVGIEFNVVDTRTGQVGTDVPWWAGTGYEVCAPITDDGFSATLSASYTPNNGIRLHIEEIQGEDDRNLGVAEFDLSEDQARWLAGKLVAWAGHNHGAARPAAPEAQGACDPSRDFQMMLARLISRHSKGLDITETMEGARDLLRRKGTLSPLREEPAPPASSGQESA